MLSKFSGVTSSIHDHDLLFRQSPPCNKLPQASTNRSIRAVYLCTTLANAGVVPIESESTRCHLETLRPSYFRVSQLYEPQTPWDRWQYHPPYCFSDAPTSPVRPCNHVDALRTRHPTKSSCSGLALMVSICVPDDPNTIPHLTQIPLQLPRTTAVNQRIR